MTRAITVKGVGTATVKPEILCSASGVSLGELLTFDYNWDDINASDTATFVWAIS